MQRRLSLLFMAFSIAPAGATMAQTCTRPTEITAAVTAPPVSVEGKENLARSAYACGHFWSAANLQEKSLAENGNALERFNLASTYARTGRYEQAEALYRSVAADGEFLNVRMDTAATEPGGRPQGFNLADEAARRLSGLAVLRRLYEPQDPTAPRSALDAGQNASVTIGPSDTPAVPSSAGSGSAAAASGAGSADSFGVDAAEVSEAVALQVQALSDEDALALDGLSAGNLSDASRTPSP